MSEAHSESVDYTGPICIRMIIYGVSTMSLAGETATIDTFVRAESDTYFKMMVEKGRFGKFGHLREPPTPDQPTVVRPNRDTLYSVAVFDLTNPVTISLPNTAGRYMAMQAINQDHYTKLVVSAPGSHTLTRAQIGTRYVLVVIRTLVNATDMIDVARATSLQDQIEWKQAAIGGFRVPNWDLKSLTSIRKHLKGLGATLSDSRKTFGDVAEVDPIRHLIGTAIGYAGNPETMALHLNVVPEMNDGVTPHLLTVKDVPVDGFWSISLYNADGFFEQNDMGAYVISDRTAKKNADGSVTIHFGGDSKADNYLPVMKGWNYTVRLYQPRKELINGTWSFPVSVAVK